MIKIGIQGIQGSFSEIAAQQFITKQAISDYKIEYLVSSENVLHAVENNLVDFGVFAMENAQGGIVIESLIALTKHCCHIVDMFHIPISQNLIALPGITKEDITEIHSHQQALRQCKDYLAAHFPNCSLIEEDDTAASAHRLQAGTLPKTAAVIASKPCATLYRLNLLIEDIQDLKEANLTLFLAVTNT